MGQQSNSLMGWGLLQRNLQEGIWRAIRIKNAHPFGTDTLIRVCFALHGHIFRICECMSCRWFLAQSSSKATGGTKQYQQSLHKVWFLTTKSNAISRWIQLHSIQHWIILKLIWSMCDFSRKQDKSVVNSWERLYKSIVTLWDLASLCLVCLTWTLFLPFSHKIGKKKRLYTVCPASKLYKLCLNWPTKRTL